MLKIVPSPPSDEPLNPHSNREHSFPKHNKAAAFALDLSSARNPIKSREQSGGRLESAVKVAAEL